MYRQIKSCFSENVELVLDSDPLARDKVWTWCRCDPPAPLVLVVTQIASQIDETPGGWVVYSPSAKRSTDSQPPSMDGLIRTVLRKKSSFRLFSFIVSISCHPLLQSDHCVHVTPTKPQGTHSFYDLMTDAVPPLPTEITSYFKEFFSSDPPTTKVVLRGKNKSTTLERVRKVRSSLIKKWIVNLELALPLRFYNVFSFIIGHCFSFITFQHHPDVDFRIIGLTDVFVGEVGSCSRFLENSFRESSLVYCLVIDDVSCLVIFHDDVSSSKIL